LLNRKEKGDLAELKVATVATIDWLAVWDRRVDRCFYVPARGLGSGKAQLHLRLRPTRNRQVEGIRFADDYSSI
jgi:hypothetical protein